MANKTVSNAQMAAALREAMKMFESKSKPGSKKIAPKKMRGGGMAKPKKMRGGGMAKKMMRGGKVKR